MKLVDVFKVTTTRPLGALSTVGIAELTQFTDFDPLDSVTATASADRALRKEWCLEYQMSDLEFLTPKGLRMFFKDGSSLTLKVK